MFFLTETMRRCGFFLEVFGLTLPDYLKCELFNENSNPDICVGQREVIEAAERASRPGTRHLLISYQQSD